MKTTQVLITDFTQWYSDMGGRRHSKAFWYWSQRHQKTIEIYG